MQEKSSRLRKELMGDGNKGTQEFPLTLAQIKVSSVMVKEEYQFVEM